MERFHLGTIVCAFIVSVGLVACSDSGSSGQSGTDGGASTGGAIGAGGGTGAGGAGGAGGSGASNTGGRAAAGGGTGTGAASAGGSGAGGKGSVGIGGSSADGGGAGDPRCGGYCSDFLALCSTDPSNTFHGQADCLTTCAGYKSGTTTGNTIECRLDHVNAIKEGQHPASECKFAAAVPFGYCM